MLVRCEVAWCSLGVRNVALCLLGAKWFGHWLGERCLGVCSVQGALV